MFKLLYYIGDKLIESYHFPSMQLARWKLICDVALAMEKSQLIAAEIKAVTQIYKIQKK